MFYSFSRITNFYTKVLSNCYLQWWRIYFSFLSLLFLLLLENSNELINFYLLTAILPLITLIFFNAQIVPDLANGSRSWYLYPLAHLCQVLKVVCFFKIVRLPLLLFLRVVLFCFIFFVQLFLLANFSMLGSVL